MLCLLFCICHANVFTFSFIPFPHLVYCRDSDSEELVTLQERQRQLLAGKSPAPEEEALESTGAKGDSPAPTATIAPSTATGKVVKEGAKSTTGGLPPRITLKPTKPAAASPSELVSAAVLCTHVFTGYHHSSPQVCEDLLADGCRLYSTESLSFYCCSLG